MQTNEVNAGSSNSSSKKGSPILTHFSPRKSKADRAQNIALQKKDRGQDGNMMTVSINRGDLSFSSVQAGDTSRSDDKARYEIKSVIMPMRNTTNNVCSSTVHRSGTMDQTSTTIRQPITSATHSYSSDSDIMPSTTTASSATAMRRLYFKSAKLSKTMQNSITTVHQQQAQHVPKVNHIIFMIFISIKSTFQLTTSKKLRIFDPFLDEDYGQRL